MDRECGTDGSQERYIQGFGVENRGNEDHLEDLEIDDDNIKMDLQEVGWEALAGLIWLRIGTGGWLL
jgi:hypothetical protein